MTKKEAGALFNLIVIMMILGAISLLISAVVAFASTTSGKVTLSAVAVALIVRIYFGIKKSIENSRALREHEEFLESKIHELQVSDRREDYVIESADYRRGNAKENLYRKVFQLSLLETFGNKCARCGSNDNGIDVDHLFFSKNEGGCFIMRHRENYLVNNALPLCRTCNRSKSDRSYRSFFSKEELLTILTANVKMTKLLNERNPLTVEGKVIRHRKSS